MSRPKKFSNKICLADGCNKPPKINKDGHYTKKGFCCTCYDRMKMATDPKFVKAVKKNNQKKYALKTSRYVPTDNKIYVDGDLLKINVNAKDLAERTGLDMAILSDYMKSLQENGQIFNFRYDRVARLYTIWVYRKTELFMNINLNEKPMGIAG